MDQLESEYFIYKSRKLAMQKLVTRIVSNKKKTVLCKQDWFKAV